MKRNINIADLTINLTIFNETIRSTLGSLYFLGRLLQTPVSFLARLTYPIESEVKFVKGNTLDCIGIVKTRHQSGMERNPLS